MKKEKCIELKPDEEGMNWEMTGYSNSDWEADTDSRRSITGWEIYLNRCLISWGYLGQKNVTLSSTEAEYVAVSEVSKEIIFLRQVLEFMEIFLEYTIVIRVENIGEIYLMKNNGGK